MAPSDPARAGAGGGPRALLAAKDKILSLAIVAAIVIPIAAVAAQVRPAASALPIAPDFRMWDTRTMHNLGLSDFRGKVVFLDIMATWCITCREQMPDLEVINRTYGGSSFVLLSVTADPTDDILKMEAYRTEFSANWTFAIPVATWVVGEGYLVTGFPTTVIVDADGLMTYRAVGRVPLATLEAHVEAALNA